MDVVDAFAYSKFYCLNESWSIKSPAPIRKPLAKPTEYCPQPLTPSLDAH
jgi:hypothetical protein